MDSACSIPAFSTGLQAWPTGCLLNPTTGCLSKPLRPDVPHLNGDCCPPRSPCTFPHISVNQSVSNLCESQKLRGHSWFLLGPRPENSAQHSFSLSLLSLISPDPQLLTAAAPKPSARLPSAQAPPLRSIPTQTGDIAVLR